MDETLNQSEDQPGCLERTLKIIGDKWSGLLIREMLNGPRRFSELQRALCGISPRTLSQRLDSMEETGIVSKESFGEVPPRVEYTLTAKGHDLFPILRQMADWGDKYR